MIEMLHITKRFGGVLALDAVSLRIQGGKVHGLLGENGAGKSTIMNVLFGLLRPDAGTITLNGREVRIGSPRTAQVLGIGMVHQHFKLVPTLTVVENFALALGISVRKIRAAVTDRMKSLGWTVPMDVRVEHLAVGQQQRVEIVKALMAAGTGGTAGIAEKVLILDEPTAVLTPQETAELFTALESLKRSNTAIVFISHKLGEVQRICDEVTILRRRRVVHSGATTALTAEAMAEKMIGAKVELPRLVRSAFNANAERAPALELRGLSAGILKNASFRVMPGEIVGIAGVDGNGQTDMVQAIVGGIPALAGSIFLAGTDATPHTIRWRSDRLAYIPEDRHRQAVVLPLSIRNNVMLKDYRTPAFSKTGWLRFGAWRTHTRSLVQRFDVRCNSIADPVGRLSGGNQQKVVLARELYDRRKPLVVAVNPTRGLDIGATAFVMRQLLEARRRGAGVLLVHSDLDELLALADRVLVLYGGSLADSSWPTATKEQIGRMMLGVTKSGSKAGEAA